MKAHKLMQTQTEKIMFMCVATCGQLHRWKRAGDKRGAGRSGEGKEGAEEGTRVTQRVTLKHMLRLLSSETSATKRHMVMEAAFPMQAHARMDTRTNHTLFMCVATCGKLHDCLWPSVNANGGNFFWKPLEYGT